MKKTHVKHKASNASVFKCTSLPTTIKITTLCLCPSINKLLRVERRLKNTELSENDKHNFIELLAKYRYVKYYLHAVPKLYLFNRIEILNNSRKILYYQNFNQKICSMLQI